MRENITTPIEVNEGTETNDAPLPEKIATYKNKAKAPWKEAFVKGDFEWDRILGYRNIQSIKEGKVTKRMSKEPAKTVTTRNLGLNDGNVLKLAAALEENMHITDLDLSKNDIKEVATIERLTEALTKNKTLMNIYVEKNWVTRDYDKETETEEDYQARTKAVNELYGELERRREAQATEVMKQSPEIIDTLFSGIKAAYVNKRQLPWSEDFSWDYYFTWNSGLFGIDGDIKDIKESGLTKRGKLVTSASFRESYLKDKTVLALAEALETNTHITDLDLSLSNIQNVATIERLTEALKKNTTLRNICVEENWVTRDRNMPGDIYAKVTADGVADPKMVIPETEEDYQARTKAVNELYGELERRRNAASKERSSEADVKSVGVPEGAATTIATEKVESESDVGISVDFSGVFKGQGQIIGAITHLEVCAPVKELNLSGNFLGNNTNPIAKVLLTKHKDSLRTLNLSACGIGSARFILDPDNTSLLNLISSAPITNLNLSGNDLGEVGMRKLGEALRAREANGLPQLEVNLAQCFLNNAKLAALSTSLGDMENLPKFIFNDETLKADTRKDNKISDVGLLEKFGISICLAFSTLDFYSVDIQLVIDGIKMPKIDSVDLSNIKISEDNAKLVAEAIIFNARISAVNLENANHEVTEVLLKALNEAADASKKERRIEILLGNGKYKLLEVVNEGAPKKQWDLDFSGLDLTSEKLQEYPKGSGDFQDIDVDFVLAIIETVDKPDTSINMNDITVGRSEASLISKALGDNSNIGHVEFSMSLEYYVSEVLPEGTPTTSLRAQPKPEEVKWDLDFSGLDLTGRTEQEYPKGSGTFQNMDHRFVMQIIHDVQTPGTSINLSNIEVGLGAVGYIVSALGCNRNIATINIATQDTKILQAFEGAFDAFSKQFAEVGERQIYFHNNYPPIKLLNGFTLPPEVKAAKQEPKAASATSSSEPVPKAANTTTAPNIPIRQSPTGQKPEDGTPGLIKLAAIGITACVANYIASEASIPVKTMLTLGGGAAALIGCESAVGKVVVTAGTILGAGKAYKEGNGKAAIAYAAILAVNAISWVTTADKGVEGNKR